ncbi:MAG: hypothetical protein HZY73_09065 [Micropruina sp.]|nr:MAG: hypothetical protein HZY73_09065 [Micropruina sp.]
MRRAALLLAGAAGLGCLLAANQPWVVQGSQTLSGVQATGGAAQAVALAGVTGALLAGWLRGWGSRLVAALTTGVFLLGCFVPAADVIHSLAPDSDVTWGTWWPPVFRGAAGLGALAGLAAALLRPGTRTGRTGVDRRLDDWQALDAGLDPTEGVGSGGDRPGGPEWDDAGHADKEPG